MLQIIDAPISSSHDNMHRDAVLLSGIKASEAILHLYSWKNPHSITCGHFVQPHEYFREGADSIADIAKRPTGGGIVFHIGDFAFSLLISSTHPAYRDNIDEGYAYVNQLVVQAFEQVFSLRVSLAQQEIKEASRSPNFCMAKLSRYDVIFQGKKIGGAAQRRVPQGCLHQGSIFLSNYPSLYRQVLLPHVADAVLEDMNRTSFFVLGESASQEDVKLHRQHISQSLISLVGHTLI